MTIIDFIELSDDDIIDLSSDEETVQEVQIATQHRATSLDRQGMFFLAGEGSQDVQAVLVAASEGSQDVQGVLVAAGEGKQEAAESGHALEATTLSLVTETPPLDTAKVKSPYCHRSPTSATFPRLTSTSPKAVTSEGGNAKLWRAKAKHPERNYHILSLVRGKSPLGLTSSSPKALSSEGGDATLVTGKVKRRRKNCQPCKLTP